MRTVEVCDRTPRPLQKPFAEDTARESMGQKDKIIIHLRVRAEGLCMKSRLDYKALINLGETKMATAAKGVQISSVGRFVR